MRREAPLRIKRAPSRLLSLALLLVHGVSGAAVLYLPLPTAIRAGLMVLLAAHAVWRIYADALLRERAAVVQLELGDGGKLRLVDRIGRTMSGHVLPGSVVLPWLVVLHYRLGRERWSRRLLLLADMCSADDLRVLRIRLRHPRPTPVADAPSTIPGRG